jgi:hypothetical protein
MRKLFIAQAYMASGTDVDYITVTDQKRTVTGVSMLPGV